MSRLTRSRLTAVRGIVWCLAALNVVLWAMLHFVSDGTPAGMLLAFAPRWWLTLPWLLLVPAAFWAGRTTAVVAVIGALVSLFGVAHFELPARTPARASRAIRVVTYNTDVRREVAHRIRRDLSAWDADIVLLQDCKGELADSLRVIAPGSVRVHARFCMVSRWPVAQVTDGVTLHALQSPTHLVRRGRSVRYLGPLRQWDSAVRYLIRTPFGDLPVYSVHLPSPRQALGTIRWLKTADPEQASGALQRSIAQRSDESAAVSSIVSRADSAYIVAGDFNLPYGSRILQRDWSDLTNAFAHAGTGFGYTMQAGVFPVRIDHLFVPRALLPISATVLDGYPSEHQPLVVDLAWAGGR